MSACVAVMALFGLGLPSQLFAQDASIRQRITQKIDERQMKTLRGNVHPMARAEFDRGRAPDNLQLNRLMLVLQRSPEQEQALQQLMQEQQTKGSPNYQKWLTPAEFGAQFGPADADVQTVTGWLGSHGFKVTHVSAGKTIVEFSGTAGQIRSAFQTEIHKYLVNGEEHWANSSDPQIPAAIAPVVAGIHSLHNFFRKPLIQKLGYYQKSKKDGSVTPLFTFTPSGGKTLNALGPTDFATIYNVLPLWNAGIDGTGQQIAIVGETNINCQDVLDFRSHFSLPATVAGFNAPILCNGKNWPVNLVLNGPDPGVTDEETEADLDVQWAGAVAKNAVIDFVISESTETEQGVDLSALYIVDNNLAPVLSESFGACEAALGNAGNQFFSQLWEQAASQGISVLISSGDAGAAGCDNPNAPFPVGSNGFGAGVNGIASTPFDVAVGGTDFDSSLANYQSTYWAPPGPNPLSALSYVPETTWNDSCAQKGLQGCAGDQGTDVIEVGGGGGPSNCAFLDASNQFCQAGYAKPSWQTGAGVPNDSVRDTPDVSLFAADGFVSGSFYIVCQSDQDPNGVSAGCNLDAPFTNFIGVGGTSSSAPTFAGILALVNQKMAQLGKSSAQGNANFVLYPMAAQSGASCSSSSETSGAGAGCVFNDVTKGNISVPCVGGSFDCNNTNRGSASFGVLVDTTYDSFTPKLGEPAYIAAAGYDMATGLGSVNATNLVNAWPNISFNPTTTTLSINPTTITHGQLVNVSIGVTSGSGTPTGDVSLIGKPAGGSQLGIDGFTLANGAASSTSTFLVGGTYPINAHYGGDGKFGASDSMPVMVTVNPEASATTVSLLYIDFNGNVHNAAASQFGTLYGAFNLIRIDVAPTGQPNCASTNESCATGNVALTDNGQPFDPAIFTGGQLKLNSLGYSEAQTTLQGAGSVTIPALTVGAHSFMANYPGDASFNASASAAAAINVAKAPTVTTGALLGTTALSVVVDTEIGGSNPKAGSYGAAPTGTITVMNGAVQIGTGNLTGGGTDKDGFVTGTATVNLTTQINSSGSLTINYSGDANYSSSSGNVQVVLPCSNVGSGFCVTAANSSLSVAVPGQAVNTNVTVTASGGFAGTVTLTCAVSPTNLSDTPGCAINPNAVSLSANKTSQTALMTFTTTAASSGRIAPPPVIRRVRWEPIGVWAMLFGLALVGIGLIRRRTRIVWLAAPVLLAGIVAAGCGGGGGSTGSLAVNNPGTAPAVYTVTITGTSGNIVQATSVTVNVQ